MTLYALLNGIIDTLVTDGLITASNSIIISTAIIIMTLHALTELCSVDVLCNNSNQCAGQWDVIMQYCIAIQCSIIE